MVDIPQLGNYDGGPDFDNETTTVDCAVTQYIYGGNVVFRVLRSRNVGLSWIKKYCKVLVKLKMLYGVSNINRV